MSCNGYADWWLLVSQWHQRGWGSWKFIAVYTRQLWGYLLHSPCWVAIAISGPLKNVVVQHVLRCLFLLVWGHWIVDCFLTIVHFVISPSMNETSLKRNAHQRRIVWRALLVQLKLRWKRSRRSFHQSIWKRAFWQMGRACPHHAPGCILQRLPWGLCKKHGTSLVVLTCSRWTSSPFLATSLA